MTTARKRFFEPFDSDMVRLFVTRASVGNSDANETMRFLVQRARKAAKWNEAAPNFRRLLKTRRIVTMEWARDLPYDGVLQPIGSRFEEGFKMLLRRKAPATRIRFTFAHELCHTFFYEYVPELKFSLHDTDLEEERVCNYGAAELLMPRSRVKKKAKNLMECLQSLKLLASNYNVSLEAMLLRLRALGLWRSELSLWHRMVDGSFSLERFFGDRRRNWTWIDPSIPKDVWTTGRPATGRTFVEYQEVEGSRVVRRVKPVSYELQRRGSGLLALWSRGELKPSDPSAALPLIRSIDRGLDPRPSRDSADTIHNM